MSPAAVSVRWYLMIMMSLKSCHSHTHTHTPSSLTHRDHFIVPDLNSGVSLATGLDIVFFWRGSWIIFTCEVVTGAEGFADSYYKGQRFFKKVQSNCCILYILYCNLFICTPMKGHTQSSCASLFNRFDFAIYWHHNHCVSTLVENWQPPPLYILRQLMFWGFL